MQAFSIGRVFSRAFGLIRDTIGTAGLFVFLLLVVETVVSVVLQPMMLENVQAAAASAENPDEVTNAALSIFGSVWYWGVLLVGLVASCLAWSGGLHGLLQYADRGETSLAECFQRGMIRFFPVLVLTVLWWLGFMLGWIVFIVPATILASMWAVALPAMIAENLGVFAAFGRSRELTRGNRLSIFGVLVLLIVIYYVLAMVIAGSMMGSGALTGALGGEAALEAMGSISPWLALAALPFSWVSGMLLKAMVASLYLESVLVKEGVRTERLTDVFE
jgi:membrane-anchored glycerophosphoryl diester phosphodiesterase (GDPDase)